MEKIKIISSKDFYGMDLNHRRKELKRLLMEGYKVEIRGTDWSPLLDCFLEGKECPEKTSSETSISLDEIKSKLWLILFEPQKINNEVLGEPISIPIPGASDDRIYNSARKSLESHITSFLYTNKVYKYLLAKSPVHQNSKINNSAKDFQSGLISFFYNNISVEDAESHMDWYEQDWMMSIPDLEVAVSEIKYKDYKYDTSELFIRRIEDFIFRSPHSILGKLIFVRKVNNLKDVYIDWKEKNQSILEAYIAMMF